MTEQNHDRQEVASNIVTEGGVALSAAPALSPARLAANRANAQLSTGPTTAAGLAISSRNNFKHGFRGEFSVLPSENQQDFDNLLASYREEHQPSTPSEDTLVDQLAKHLWLSLRAERLQDLALTSDDDPREQQKSFALYLRYQTTNNRGFSKCLNDLLRIRAQKFREQLGFERQKHREAMDAERLKQKQAAQAERQKARDAAEARKQELHQARVRTANARAEDIEQKTEIEGMLNADLPGHTRIPFWMWKNVAKRSIEEVAAQLQEDPHLAAACHQVGR